MSTFNVILGMPEVKDIRKQFNLRCVFCNIYFRSRQSKSRHTRMNRCPELKKLTEGGQVVQGHPTKKSKVGHESYIIRSEEDQEQK